MNSKRANKIKNQVITAVHGDDLNRKQRQNAMKNSSTAAMYKMRKKNYLRKKRKQDLLSA